MVIFGESTDGGSMLRPNHFATMQNETERALRKKIIISGNSTKTLSDYVYYSSQPIFDAIQVLLIYFFFKII